MNDGSARTELRSPTGRVSNLAALVLVAAVVWAGAQTAALGADVGAASNPPAPKAYVALHDEGALAVIDTGRNRVLYYLPVPLSPRGLAITPDGRKLYVGSDQVSTVSVIDTATDRIVRTIEAGLSPYGLSLDGRHLLVSAWAADQVALIDTATDTIAGRLSIAHPGLSAISPDGRTAYIGSSSPNDPALVIVDLVKRAVTGRVPLAHALEALDLSRDGTRLYFTMEGTDAMQVFDTRGNRIVATVTGSPSPHGLVLGSEASGELVVSQSRGEMAIVDPVRNVVRGVVAVGRHPYGIATGPDDRTVYVTNEGSGDVSVVDLVDRRVTATILVDAISGLPREIAVQPRPVASASAGHGRD
jgi:YVTN family beta-propeller protein